MMAGSFSRFASVVCLLVFFSACSHAPKGLGLQSRIQPRQLLLDTCSAGSSIHEVKGLASMKAKSKDASGQFSAIVQALAPHQLTLEVLRPFGGTYAILKVDGLKYRIDVPGKPERNRQGSDSWGGIPLRWSTDLFLGRIPCPSSEERVRSSVSITPEDELIVEIRPSQSRPGQKFIYEFEDDHGRYRPKKLRWESGKAAVDFQFHDFEEKTGSPQKWEASSSQGEVKFRWRDRELAR